MKVKIEQLIQELIELTREHLNYAEQLKSLSEEELSKRISEYSWNVLECFEHLNLYGNFYLPEIEKRIRQSDSKREPEFKSGLLGNYFANSMLPRKKLNKMKTFRQMDPLNKPLNKTTLTTFTNQQENLLHLLTKANEVSLTKIKTSISISKFLKLRLGDTFRVVIYHNKRHIKQAQNILEQTKNT